MGGTGVTASPTLGQVLEHVGATLVVLAAPRGLDVAVHDVVVGDPTEAPAYADGDVVLGVGLQPGDLISTPLLGALAGRGVTALVLRVTADVAPAVVARAESSGVALVAVPPEVTWSQLHLLLRTAVLSAGQPLELIGGASVPLGDLFGLANAVAEIVSAPVTIEDARSRVLAYSASTTDVDELRRDAILTRRVDDRWIEQLRKSGALRRLWDGEVVRVDALDGAPGMRPRLAVAIRVGGEVLGSIWAAQASRPFDQDAVVALQEVAKLAAPHLIRYRAGDDTRRRMRAELLRSLLDGHADPADAARRLGLAPSGSFRVIAFELLDIDDSEALLRTERLASTLDVYAKAYRWQLIEATAGRVVYALLDLPPERSSTDAALTFATEVVEGSRQLLNLPLRAGVGGAVTSLAEVRASREVADLVLRALASDDLDRTVASMADVRSQVLLLAFGDAVRARPELGDPRLELLAHSDRTRGTVYLATLRAYLDAMGDSREAAQALGVHPNTLRYRLRRACEIATLDLTVPAERLAVELQLRLQ